MDVVRTKVQPKQQARASANKWINPSFDDFDVPKTSTSSSIVQKGVKRQKKEANDSNFDFLPITLKAKSQNDTDLWVEKYHPCKTEDLAVHKKKVSEVQNWLNDVLSGKLKNAPFLLMTGPAGCGKSATIKVLVKEMKLDLQEWLNPATESTSSFGSSKLADNIDYSFQSQTQQFRDFLLRSNKYTSLQISEAKPSPKKVILLEEFPNAFYRDTNTFHDALRAYKVKGNCPMVFIISDGEGSDSTERLLFPPDLQTELRISKVSFNPVAPTSLSKVLTKILTQESSRTSRIPQSKVKSVVESVATSSLGDIRAAINALQFTAFRALSQKSSQLHTSSSKGAKDSKSGEKDTAVASRDASLFLFRGLGKVLYCKRDKATPENQEPLLPDHLRHHYRDPLQFSPEDVVEKTHVSGEFFSSFLHQNYVDFFTNFDDVVVASDYLSDADYLTTDWSSRVTMREYASSVATRGLLFANSTRALVGEKSTSLGWKPLHKPEWFQVMKKSRENNASSAGLFRLTRLPTTELVTQMLPYLCQMKTKLQNPAQASLLQYLGNFRRNTASKIRHERLDEKEVSVKDEEDEGESEEKNVLNQNTTEKEEDLEENCPPFDDIEIEIDDFDDDW